MGYYRRCIPDFARVAKPLLDLLKDGNENVKKTRSTRRSKPKGQLSSNTPGNWTKQHQQALEHLITCLVQSPILAYSDYDRRLILHTDASANGLGAVLYQRQNGNMRFIGYGPRTVNSAEKGYH